MRTVGTIILAVFCSTSLQADLAQYARHDPRLNVAPINKGYGQIEGYAAQAAAWNREFKGAYGPNWEILIDLRSGRPGRISGQGLPVVPGLGNDLPYDHEITRDDIESIAFSFLKKHASLFNLDLDELVINGIYPVDDFWYVNYDRYYRGIRVADVQVFLTISHGNLVKAACKKYGTISVNTNPTVKSEQAVAAMFQAIGGSVEGDALERQPFLMVYPIWKNGDRAEVYTGGMGDGYAHLLVWSITFDRPEEGPWTGLVDAHSGALLSFSSASADGYKLGHVTGNVYAYQRDGWNSNPVIVSKAVGMPFTDIRYHYAQGPSGPMSCYGTGIATCMSSEDYCIPEVLSTENVAMSCSGAEKPAFQTAYCTTKYGRFCYDEVLSPPLAGYTLDAASSLMTRLFSPYAAIWQYYSNFQNGLCTCADNGKINFICATQEANANDILLAADPGDNIDSCTWTQATSTPPPGNSFSARTAYYHAIQLKMKWLQSSLLDSPHTWPVENPICRQATACPVVEGSPDPANKAGLLKYWLTSRQDIFVHTTGSSGCDVNANASVDPYPTWEGSPPQPRWDHRIGKIYLCEESHQTFNNRDSGEVPGVLYHEMGHGLDEFDGVPQSTLDYKSSDAYADIVALLMTRDSCIARGWHKTGYCYGDGNYYPCTLCDGFRELDSTKHGAVGDEDAVRTITKCITSPESRIPNGSSCPKYQNDGTLVPMGPCGRETHCEGEIVGQAFWDLKEQIKARITDSLCDDDCKNGTAWEITDRLFRRAVHQVDPAFYSCREDRKAGCADSITNPLFMMLWEADDNDARLDNEPPHSVELCNAFGPHQIACYDDELIYCKDVQSPSVCAAIAKPTLPMEGISAANNIVYMNWETVEGAFNYDVMRSELGPLASYIRVGTVSETEFKDMGLMNGFTYWYRIVPNGASRSCIGPLSDARQATPLAGVLLILPDTQRLWLKGAYQTRPLEAYGGSGAYAWSVASGALPAGVSLNPLTGELYGAPTVQAVYTFTIKALDKEDGSLVGTRTYTLEVKSSMSDLDFIPTVMPFGYVLQTLTIPLTPSGGSFTGYQFTIEQGELPPGMALVGSQSWPVEWSIQGRPYCGAGCNPRGVYPFVLSLRDSAGHYIERSFNLAVLTNTSDFLLSPDQGTTAGGTPVRMYFNANVMPADLGIKFDLKDVACSASIGQAFVAETVAVAYAPVWPATAKIVDVTTPLSLEGCADVKVYNGTSLFKTVTNAFRFKVLAATTNSQGDALSLLEPAAQSLYAAKPGIGMGRSPRAMDFSRGAKPGRTLMVTDNNTGNLSMVDMGPLTLMGTLAVQEGGQRYFESDVAVDPSGTYAFVTHVTKGYPRGVAMPPVPVSGGVTVVALGTEACLAPPCAYDLDGNITTTSPGAPEGITRLYDEAGTLYPLNIEVLNLSRPIQDDYAEGEKYPGYFAFVSGVGEAVVECLDPDCNEYHYLPRPARIGILDLNPYRCKSDGSHPCGLLDPNPEYWKTAGKILGPIDFSAEGGGGLGNTNQGIGFDVDFAQEPVPHAVVYAVNEAENRVYKIEYGYDPATQETSWSLSADFIPTGVEPTDAKVALALQNGIEKKYLFITNGYDGTVTTVDVENDQAVGPDQPLQAEFTAGNLYPTALATYTRGEIRIGLTSNHNDGTVSIFNLDGSAFINKVPVGAGPFRIVAQPQVDIATLSFMINSGLALARPSDFTTDSKQTILIRDWENVQQLQETIANPQGVVANVDNFQRNMNKWVTDEPLKSDLNHAVDLYRAAYIKDNPASGGR